MKRSTRTYGNSLLRREEYRALSSVSIEGTILDIGGSSKSGYHELVGGTHEFIVANIDESYGVDVVFDAEEPWPVSPTSVDGVLFMNVLEHLYKYDAAVIEAYAALKSGGMLVGSVPFMFNVHGSPNDYFRYTKSTLERLLADAGFSEIDVRELGTGGFSVMYHVLLGLMRNRFIASAGMWIATHLDGIAKRVKKNNTFSEKHMPLGYFFTAVKPQKDFS